LRAALILGTGLLAAFAPADRVTGWRGDGSGLFPDARPPLSWTGAGAASIRWTCEVGESYSSPVVSDDRVFVTAEPDLLACVHAESGKLLWSQATRFDDLPKGEGVKPEKLPATSCGYSTPTPVSDGRRVVAVFGSGLVGCYDLNGKRLWIRNLSVERPLQYGRSASPLIVGSTLVLFAGCLQALDLESGRSLWKADGLRETYGSPAIARIGDVPMVITPGGDLVRVADGKVLASQLGKTDNVTPLVRGRIVYFVDQQARAVELSQTPAERVQVRELWKQELDGEFFASPVLHEGLLYTVNNGGTLLVLDATTGKTVTEKELTLPAPEKSTRVGKFYPSLALIGSVLFVGDDAGASLWLKPGKSAEEAGRNLLPGGAGSTPAVAAARLFLRGGTRLYGIVGR
jgi:outer membrane protein assembly factor BamB